MSGETIREKASRLIASGSVRRQIDLPDGGSVWLIQGDNHTRRVTVDADGSALCDCPFLGNPCSHILAVLGTGGFPEPPEAPDEDEPPEPIMEVEHVRRPGRHDEDWTGQTEPPEVLDPSTPIDESTGDAGVEPGPAPLTVATAAEGRVELPLDQAPLTWKALETISRTDFVPASLRGKPSACLAAIYYGRELGLGPMTSLSEVAIIDGSPSPSARILLNLYRKSGHALEVVRADEEQVTVKGTRGDSGETLEVSFTLDDAERAGLVRRDQDGIPRARSRNGAPLPWEQYPADLLWSRAVTRLVRRLAPDAVGR